MTVICLRKIEKKNANIVNDIVDDASNISLSVVIFEVNLVESNSRVIGSLMYLISCTRPNIAYAISKIYRYTMELTIGKKL